ncbi:MAG TPA: efflux RND transporter periplasmic adaptor subunit [Candidatus Baltobacteraceae bacterium]|nr:efflux RND transporter periplasmic adaptor subunit [Candidatus Baltobacteraceae bacterium]
MNRTRNTLIVVGAIAAIVALAVFAGRHGHDSALPVKLQKIAYSAFTITLPEEGVVMNPTTVTVPTLVAGNLGQIYVKAGSRVSAGELLATIENPTLDYNAASSQADYTNAVANVSTARIDEQNARVQYLAQVDTTKSALDEARRVYEADAALLAQKAIARSQVDADKAKLDQAQVAYDQAVQQLRLGAVSGYGIDSVQAAQANAEKSKIINAQNQQQVAFTRIVAPMNGIVQTVAAQSSNPLRTMQPGDVVTAGEGLFTIAAENRFVVKAQVDEQDIINVHLGQTAKISGQDFPGHVILGHVVRIDPAAQKSTDASSTSMQVLTTISLDRSPSFLKDGMNADIDILTTDIPHAIAVPTEAIQKTGKMSFVYLVNDGVATKRTISTGRVGNGMTQVLSGLAPGDVIVAAKVPALAAGARVTPMPSPSSSP